MARAHPIYDAQAQRLLTGFYGKQELTVLAALDRDDPDWWDKPGWDKTLRALLYGLMDLVATDTGRTATEALGFGRSDYDQPRTVAYLLAVAAARAVNLNATTKTQLDAARNSDGAITPADVFTLAKTARATSAAAEIVTHSSGFGITEAARQLSGGRAVKTWLTGTRPRPSHAAMNGETVPIDAKFSNGLNWPGDGGNAEEVAGCNCGVETTIP